MALNPKILQAKLDDIQKRANKSSGDGNQLDFKKIFWKPKLGKQVVRILPSKFNKDWPFHEMYFFNDILGKKRITSLKSWGEKDPIVQFAEAIWNSGDDEDKETARKLFPKKRIFVHVLVRGEENLGPRLWEFGNEVGDQILQILDNSDYGDITDINSGRDITVNGVNASYNGNNYVKPTVTPKPDRSPITTDPELLQKVLNEQTDPLNFPAFKKYTFDELKDLLEKWLNPEDATDTPTTAGVVHHSTTNVVIKSSDLPVPADADLIDDLPFVPDPPKAEVKPSAKKTTKKESSGKTNKEKIDEFFK